jgi:hypothetical protein
MNSASLPRTAPAAARLSRTPALRDSGREARAYDGLVGSLLRRGAARRRALPLTDDRPRSSTGPAPLNPR